MSGQAHQKLALRLDGALAEEIDVLAIVWFLRSVFEDKLPEDSTILWLRFVRLCQGIVEVSGGCIPPHPCRSYYLSQPYLTYPCHEFKSRRLVEGRRCVHVGAE